MSFLFAQTLSVMPVSLTALLAATAAMFVFGALWYGLWSKPWMEAVGKTEEELKQGSNFSTYATSAAVELVMVYVLAHFVVYGSFGTGVGQPEFMDGFVTGLWISVGFVATTMLINKLYSGTSWKLYLIDAGHFVIGLAIAGGLLAAIN